MNKPHTASRKKIWPRILPNPAYESRRATLEAEFPGVNTNREAYVEAVFKLAGNLGMTDHKGELVIGIPGNSYRPSRRKLEQRGEIFRQGDRRRLPTGRDAEVFVHRYYALAEDGGGGA
ncbi:MAG: hypothetical protein AAFN41_01885 [Planctomycetota bacterium]